MTSAKASQPRPELSGQTVLVLGGSAGIGLATARHARAQGAHVILVARNAERLRQAAEDVGSRQSAAFDVGDRDGLQEFFASLPGPVTHVMVNAGWPFYGPVLDLTYEEARTAISYHALQAVEVARNVETQMSASLLADRLQARRDDLQSRLPIRRVLTAEDVAALAVHLMSNTALTGAVYDIYGGQQLIP